MGEQQASANGPPGERRCPNREHRELPQHPADAISLPDEEAVHGATEKRRQSGEGEEEDGPGSQPPQDLPADEQ